MYKIEFPSTGVVRKDVVFGILCDFPELRRIVERELNPSHAMIRAALFGSGRGGGSAPLVHLCFG